jgi:hypothetical protein
MDSTAKNEVNASGGTYSETTMSNQALSVKTGGLTAQQTRDALTLAPTLTPADGSIDSQIAGIPAEILITPTQPIATDAEGNVSTVGGGLNAQQTRDAMTLAPTLPPATGSVDALLNDIDGTQLPAITAAIAALPTEGDIETIETEIAGIPAATDAQLASTHGSGAWGSGVAGINTVTVVAAKTDGARVGGVRVFIKNANGDTIKDGVTDSNGSWITSLDNGVFTFLSFLTGWDIDPVTQTISGDAQVNIIANPANYPTPAVGVQIMCISARDMGGVFDSGATVTANIISTNVNIDGATITAESDGVVDVVNQTIDIALVKGATCLIRGMSHGKLVISGTITVSQAALSVPTDYPNPS